LPQSGGNTKFRQNIRLKKNPQDDDQNEPANTHFHKPSQKLPKKNLATGGRGSLNAKQRTAAGPYAQENPPLGDEQEVLLSPLFEVDDPHEKEDRSLHTSRFPQTGQTMLSSLSEGKRICSKV
jgi:hypothetical protein